MRRYRLLMPTAPKCISQGLERRKSTGVTERIEWPWCKALVATALMDGFGPSLDKKNEAHI